MRVSCIVLTCWTAVSRTVRYPVLRSAWRSAPAAAALLCLGLMPGCDGTVLDNAGLDPIGQTTLPADRPVSVGKVEQSSGPARIERRGSGTAIAQPGPGEPSPHVQRGDLVATGPSGRLSIRLADGTRLVLGERTTIAIRQFFADPRTGTSAMALELQPASCD